MSKAPHAPPITAVDPQAQWPTKYTVDPSGCWLYDGGIRAQSGYGYAKYEGKVHYVHRLMYRLHVGEIPEGMTIDHVDCVARHCVRPDHLEVVTIAENSGRMRAKLLEKRDGMCAAGLHRMADTRRKYRGGTSQCGACHDAKIKEWKARQKILRAPAAPGLDDRGQEP